MQCDMCGSESKLFKAVIEGSELKVCSKCSKFGKVIGRVRTFVSKKQEKKMIRKESPKAETIQVVVSNYGELIRKKRESLKLKQKEFAKSISERESIVHSLESSKHEPSLDLARKIERSLGIKLIEQHEEVHSADKKKESGKFTIGDFIKVRK